MLGLWNGDTQNTPATQVAVPQKQLFQFLSDNGSENRFESFLRAGWRQISLQLSHFCLSRLAEERTAGQLPCLPAFPQLLIFKITCHPRLRCFRIELFRQTWGSGGGCGEMNLFSPILGNFSASVSSPFIIAHPKGLSASFPDLPF